VEIHEVDQEVQLQREGVVRLHTHQSPRDATHTLLRALHQDLQGPEEAATVHLNEIDPVREADRQPNQDRTLAR